MAHESFYSKADLLAGLGDFAGSFELEDPNDANSPLVYVVPSDLAGTVEFVGQLRYDTGETITDIDGNVLAATSAVTLTVSDTPPPPAEEFAVEGFATQVPFGGGGQSKDYTLDTQADGLGGFPTPTGSQTALFDMEGLYAEGSNCCVNSGNRIRLVLDVASGTAAAFAAAHPNAEVEGFLDGVSQGTVPFSASANTGNSLRLTFTNWTNSTGFSGQTFKFVVSNL